MREAYHDQLGDLADQLSNMCGLVGDAMEQATRALLDADLAVAERVISGDAKIDDARAKCEEDAYSLLALQAPVATDLRTVLSVIHAAESLERMGDLALHVAKAARRRHPASVLPDEVRGYFEEMGRIAVDLARKAQEVIRTQDVDLARRLDEEDDAMDDLHRHLFSVIMDKDWGHGVPSAVDITLLGRFYERFGDHAVSVAKRTVFVVTGRMPGYPSAADDL
jgi:phosphate transport system protein